jgi:hypothetical protein
MRDKNFISKTTGKIATYKLSKNFTNFIQLSSFAVKQSALSNYLHTNAARYWRILIILF